MAGLSGFGYVWNGGLGVRDGLKNPTGGLARPRKNHKRSRRQGRTVAREAEAALNRAGWDVELILRPDNAGDVADELAGAIEEKAAIVEHDGGVSSARAITVAWGSFAQKGKSDS